MGSSLRGASDLIFNLGCRSICARENNPGMHQFCPESWLALKHPLCGFLELVHDAYYMQRATKPTHCVSLKTIIAQHSYAWEMHEHQEKTVPCVLHL